MAINVFNGASLLATYDNASLVNAVDFATTQSGADIRVVLDNGDYTLTSQLNIDADITLIGESQAGVRIHAETMTQPWAIALTADNATLSNFTLSSDGATAGGTQPQRGIKAFPDTAVSTDSLTGITIESVTVQGFFRAEIDLNGVDNSILSNVTANGMGTGGAGIALTDSNNITLHNITTDANGWGGVAIYTGGGTYQGGSDTITFTGTFSSTGEAQPILTQNAGNAFQVTNLTLPAGYEYAVFNDSYRLPGTDSTEFLTFFHSEADAVAYALGVPNGAQDSVIIKDGTAGGIFTPGELIVANGMSVQAAIDYAAGTAAADTIVLAAGTYSGNVTIGTGVTLLGANDGIAGQDGRGAESILTGQVTLTSTSAVVIDGVKFLDATDASTADSRYSLLVNSSASGNVIRNSVFDRSEATAGTSNGGQAHRGLEISSVPAGASLLVEHNLFTSTFAETNASSVYTSHVYRSGIYSNGGLGTTTISDNTFEYTRSAINADGFSSNVTISGNGFTHSGTGVSVGVTVSDPVTSIHHNTFDAVDTEFNFQNLAAAVNFDLSATSNTATDSGSAATPVVVLGGSAADNLTGTSGSDYIVANGGNDTLRGNGGADALDGGAGTDTAAYTGTVSAGMITLSGGGWQVASASEGTDTLSSIEVVDGAEAGKILLVGNGGYATIQAAIDAADANDTIVVGAGTFSGPVNVNKSVTIIGQGDATVIEGTFKTDNNITSTVYEALKLKTSYTGAAGNGVTIAADNVTIQNLKISSFNTGIELGDGIDHTLVSNVTIADTVNGIRKGTEADVNDLTVSGGTIRDSYIGVNFAKTTTAGQAANGLADDITFSGTAFTNLTEKGIYAEALSNAHITGITMNNVGQFGRGYAFGGAGAQLGFHGAGIDINLKNGVYSNIQIDNFSFTNVGSSNRDGAAASHENAGAITVKTRDDAPSYSPTPASYTGSVIITDGTIDGTSTGIRAGEAGKTIGGPAVAISDVSIQNAVHSALHGDVANVTLSTTTVTLTTGDDVFVASPTSTGSLVIDGGDGNDTITAGNGADQVNGGIGADTLNGLGGNDVLTGGTGADGLDGGTGTDTAVYTGSVDAAMITRSGSNWIVASGSEGTDTLSNVEIMDGAGAGKILLVGNGGFATIQEALANAAAGDTVMLASGTYSGDVTIGAGITLLGANSGIAGQGGRGAESILTGQVTLTSTSAVVIDGVKFLDATDVSTADSRYSLLVNSSASGNVIRNSVFDRSEATAGTSNGGQAHRGLEISSVPLGASLLVEHNLFTSAFAQSNASSVYTAHVYRSGIYSNGGPGTTTISDNTFEYTRSAINADGFSSNVTISGNTFAHSGTGVSVGVTVSDPVTSIHHNTFNAVDTEFNFQNLAAAVNFDLSATSDTATDAGSAATPVVVLGGSAADHITGTSGSDYIVGNGGADTLSGLAGNDYFVGVSGNDTLSGGNDIDTAQYTSAISASSFSYVGGQWTVTTGTDGTDTLDSVEKVVFDGADADTNAGNAAAERFYLVGGGAYATQDAAKAAAQADGGGTVIAVNNSGGVTSYQVDAAGAVTGTGSADSDEVDLSNTTQNVTYDAGGGNDDVTTGSGSDHITAGSGDDTVHPGDGNDVVQLGDGNDTAVGGQGGGDDIYDGGAGSDTVTYPSATHSVRIDLTTSNRSSTALSGADGAGPNPDTVGDLLSANGYASTTAVGLVTGVDVGTDVLISIENATGGGGDDVLIGNSVNNTLDGAGGIDTVDYSGVTFTAAGGLNITLGGTATGGPIGTDTLINIENVVGSSRADTINGDEFDNVITGGGGNDSINGDADPMTGDGGLDTAVFTSATPVDGMAIQLSTDPSENIIRVNSQFAGAGGTEGADILTNIDRIRFTGGNANAADDIEIVVTAGNAEVYARNDSSAAQEDVTVTKTAAFGVLSNDINLDQGGADLKAVVDVTFNTTTVSAGAALAGTYGTLTLASNGSYTYLANSAAAEALAAGQPVTEVFTYSVTDGEGASDTATLTFNLTGANDVVTITSSAQAGTVTEDADVTASTADTLAVNGTVAFNDVDLTDVHLATFTQTGGSTTLGAFALGTVSESATTEPGSVGWTYTLTNSAAQYLAQGQTVTETYTVTVNDQNGSSVPQDVVITITGTNDTPVASADVNSATEDGAAVTGTVATNDVDADSAASLTYALNAPVAGLTMGTDGGYSFDPTDAAYQHIAQGASADVVASYTVTDQYGASSSSTLTITVGGVNDAPVIAAGGDTGAVFEEGDLDNVTEANVAVDSRFEPNQQIDVLGIINAHGGMSSNYDMGEVLDDVLALLPAGVGISGLGDAIAVVWDFVDDGYVSYYIDDVNAAAVRLGVEYADYLEAGGEPLLDVTAKYIADDGSDADTLPQRQQSLHDNLLGNVHGPSIDDKFSGNATLKAQLLDLIDAHGHTALLGRPYYGGYQGEANNALAWDQGHGYAPLASGDLNASDVDDGAVLAWSGNAATAYGTFAIDATTGVWSYTLNNASSATQALNEGDVLTETFTATVTDVEGASATRAVTITITGSNDAPVASAAVNAVNEDATISGNVSASDVDDGETAGLAYALVNAAPAGLTFNADGSYTFNADSYDSLNVGEPLVLTIPYRATDVHGAISASANLVITITGTNDTPVAQAAVASVNEDASISGSVVATDADSGETATLAYALVNPAPAGLSFDTHGNYTFDASSYDSLNQGEQQVLTIAYTATDENGATSASANLVITITGTNDTPVASADVNSATEDGATVTGTVATNDVDVDSAASLTYALNAPVAGLTMGTDGGYSFDPTDAAYQHIAQGASADVVASYTVTDQYGASSSSTLTITVGGVNDAPVIAAGGDTGAVFEEGDLDNVTEANVAVDSRFEPNQQIDVLGIINAHGGMSSNYDMGEVLDDVLALLPAGVGISGLGDAIAVVWDFVDDGYVSYYIDDVNAAAVRLGVEYADYLEAGGKPLLDVTAKYIADDGSDADTLPQRQQSLHDNLLGNVHGPSIDDKFSGNATLKAQLLDLIDAHGHTALLGRPYYGGYQGEANNALAWDQGHGYAPLASGDLNASDVDDGAVLAWSGNAATAYGTFAIDAATGVWSYTLNNASSATQALNEGDVLTETFTATVTDVEGASATRAVTITITGSNDAPVASAAVNAVNEDATISGNVSASDVDDGETAGLAYALVNAAPAGLTFNADGSYTFNADSYDSLNVGEPLVLTIPYRATDVHGAISASANLVITITGTNDTPVAQAAVASVNEDASISGSVVATDADSGETATLAYALVNPAPAGLTFNGDGSYTFDASSYDSLNQGEQQVLTIAYTATDENGATSASANLVITITGTNDTPVASADVNSATEDGATVTGTVATNDVDVDSAASLTYALNAPVAGLTMGTDGGYSFDPTDAAYQHIAQGASADVVASYTVTDEHGASSSSTLTITVGGVNDAPVIAAGGDTGAVFEEGDLDNVTEANVAVDGRFEPNQSVNVAALLVGDYDMAAVLTNVQGQLTAGAGLADAIAVVWDYIDDVYSTGGQYYNNAINEAAVRLGIEYADYLDDGGRPLLDVVAKYVADGGDAGSAPDRLQPLHDNLLGNLHGPSMADKFNGGTDTPPGSNGGSNGTVESGLYAELVALATLHGHGDIIASRPIYSGSEGAVNTALAWDQANGYVPLAAGDLNASDVDDGAVLTWSGNAAGTYGTFAIAASTGEWSYTLDNASGATQGLTEGQPAIETFTATVTDEHGASATRVVTITITGSNDAPVASAAVNAVNEDATISGNVSASDVDAGETATLGYALVNAAPAGLTFNGDGSYTFDASSYDSLNVGEPLVLTIPYRATDVHGAISASANLVITITGTNDTPVAQAAVASVNEDASITGSVVATDADSGETATLAYALVNPAPAGLTFNGDGSYSFDASSYDSLADGEQQVLTVPYTATDENSAVSDTANLVITITGTNDGVTITSADAAAAVVEDTTLVQNGTVVFNDVDLTDDHLATSAALPANTTALGAFTLGAVSESATTESGSVSWNYALNNAAAQYLAAGQSASETYRITLDDQQGSTITQDVVITITGSNDGVTITSADAAAAVVEDTTLVQNGTVVFDDVDLTDAHLATSAALPANTTALGAFTLGSVSESATTESGSVSWSYALNNAAAQYLAAGQSASETYRITLDDQHGSTITQDVVITITGSNDGVTITSADAAATVVEDATLVQNGTVVFNDVDLTDAHLATSAALPANTTALGAFTLGSVSESATTESGSVSWSYALNNTAAQYLAVGESVNETYRITLDDQHGSTITQDVVITVSGANDGVSITSGAQAATVTEDATTTASTTDSLVANGTIDFTDADFIDTHAVSFAQTGGSTSLGAFSLASVSESATTATGSLGWTYTLTNSAAQYLRQGETVTETYTVTLNDGHGSTTTQDVVITVSGTNDQPTIASGTDASGSFAESSVQPSSGVKSDTGTVVFADVDLADTHTATKTFVSAVVTHADTTTTTIADVGSFQLSSLNEGTHSVGWTYTANESALDFLNDGDTLVVTYNVNVIDNSGTGSATVTQPVTLTITGTDEIISGDGDITPLGGTSFDDQITAGAGDDTVNAGNGNDEVWGTDGDDILNGGSGNDVLDGGADDDQINGGSGNDVLIGGGGNDVLDGGSNTTGGADIAVFSGAWKDYIITHPGDFTVADQRSGAPDGTDTVKGNVEQIRFLDGANPDVTVALNNAVVSAAPTINGATTTLSTTEHTTSTGPAPGTVIGTITVTDANLSAGVGEAVQYSLTGDSRFATGTTSTTGNTQTVQIVYNGPAPIDYEAQHSIALTLVATDAQGLSASAGVTINVSNVNEAPVTSAVTLAAIAEDSGVRLITQAQLLANASDPEGTAMTAQGLTISSGAGSLVDNGNGTWNYTPALNDDTAVSFNYSITDGSLSTAATATLDITPVNDAPSASPVNLGSVAEEGSFVITAAQLLGGVTDVDGPAATITSFSLTSGNGTLVDNGGGTWTYTGALNDDTSASFAYTASDGSLSSSSTASLDITPVNDAPSATAVALGSVAEDGSIVITAAQLLAGVSDVDGPAATITSFTLTSGNGTLVDNGNSTWTYTGALNDDTSASFAYTASDGSLSSSSTASLDITPVNDAPSATPVNLGSVAEEGSIVITAAQLLGGVTDVDGPAPTITSFTLTSGNGTLVDNGGGTWTYTGALNDDTSASFAYTASDGSLSGSSTATLDITPVNDAPTNSPVVLAAIAEDSGVRLITQADLLANAHDVDSSLTAVGLSISGGAGSLVDNGNGTWNYTPALNDDTSVSFSYTVTDGSLTAPGAATLDITPVNDAPTTSAPVTLAAIVEDSGARLITQVELLANASDVDSSGLSAINLAISSGAGSLVNNGNGTWSYTPAANDDTAVAFSYQVSDGTSNTSTSATLDITPVNDTPSFLKGNNEVVTLNAARSVPGWATQVSAGPGESGQTVNFLVSNSNPGLFTVAPTIAADGTLAYTAGGAAGTATISVRVHDNAGGADTSAIQTFTITVASGTTLTGGTQSDTIVGTSANETLTGLDGNDVLQGGGGDDQLNGGVGADAMTGGLGNDTYYVDDAGDTTTEASGQGTDTVQTTVSTWTLAANVENVTYGGAGTFSGTGNDLANSIAGGGGNDTLNGLGGNDTLNGRGGSDTMTGGTGDDTYIVDNAGDHTVEIAGEGSDTVQTSLVSYTLEANVETLIYTGLVAFQGTGNADANNIYGGNANDILIGGGGDDYLNGSGGDDVLIGGAGIDGMRGGAGSDRFDFNDITEGRDTILDFTTGAGNDKLDIKDVLIGYVPGTSNIANFVHLIGAGDTTVQVNADGVGSDFVSLVKLQGLVNTASLLNDMMVNGNLVVS